MKNLITALLVILFFSQAAFAQNKFYHITFYGGINPKQSPLQTGILMNRHDPMNEFVFNLTEIEKSYVFGIQKNFRFSYPFFGTLGLQYSQQKEHYSQHFMHREPGYEDYNLSISSGMFTLPAGVGVKLNQVDITSGLQLQYTFKSALEEDIPMGIELNETGLAMGWYTGIGYTYHRTRFGIQYQSTLNRYGHNLMHQQKSMELRSIPGNFSFKVGFSF